jgi:hypothetical protein
MQSEQQHGDGHSDGQCRSLTQMTERPNQPRQAGATQDPVDRRHHADPVNSASPGEARSPMVATAA